MHEQEFINVQSLVSKVERLKEAQPYLQFVATVQSDLKQLKKPIIQAVRQSVRCLSQKIHDGIIPGTEFFNIRRPQIEEPSNSSGEQSNEWGNPKHDAYRYAFRAYKKEKDQQERLKKEEKQRDEIYERRLKQVNDRINKIELEYEAVDWDYAPEHSMHFDDSKQLINNYLQIFETQLKKKKPVAKNSPAYSLQLDEYQMRNRIFDQLSKDEIAEFVSRVSLKQFLLDHPLLMIYYNISPKQLQTELKYFESSKSDVLMRNQFHKYLTMPRETNNVRESLDTRDSEHKVECVLEGELANLLRKIYVKLDTYGRNEVKRQVLIDYLSNRKQKYSELLHANCIYFPEIRRHYTLGRIIRDLDYFEQMNAVTWQQLWEYINNFSIRQDRPTVDNIQQQQVLKGKLSGSFIYIVGKEFLDLVKRCFDKCLRFSKYFVRKDDFIQELTNDERFTHWAGKLTRVEACNGLPPETIRQTVDRIKRQGKDYIDIDEIIEYFSFKGKSDFISPKSSAFLSQQKSQESQQSEQSIIGFQKKPKRRKRRNGDNLSSLSHRKLRITVPEEFHLALNAEHQKQSIRKKKLNEMLDVNREKQQSQLRFQFKATPVPRTNSPEYKPKFKTETKPLKESKSTPNYMPLRLLINPNFWNRKKPEQVKPHCSPPQPSPKIPPKPLPKNIKDTHLLEKIQQKNEQRRYQIYQSTIKNYQSQPLPPAIARLLTPKSQITVQEPPKQQQPIIKATPVPNFSKIHASLQQTKKARPQSATKPVQFRLSISKSKPEFRVDDSRVFEEVRRKERKANIEFMKKSIESKVDIPKTKKYETMVNMRESIEEMKQTGERFRDKQEQEKKKRRKEFARFMFRNVPQVSTKKILEWQTHQKLSRFKEEQKQLAKETEQQIAQIYQRVLQRPFLYEGHNDTTANTKKIQKKNRNTLQKKHVRIKQPDDSPQKQNDSKKQTRQQHKKEMESEPFNIDDDEGDQDQEEMEIVGFKKHTQKPLPYQQDEDNQPVQEEQSSSRSLYAEKNFSF